MTKHKLGFIPFLFICLMALFSSGAHAAELNFGIVQTQTGGLVGSLNTVNDDYCDVAPYDGCDFSNTDNIVRTNDDVEYEFNASVGPAGDDPVIITVKLDPGLMWPTLPSSCLAQTSSITGDGTAASPSVLNCDLGAKAAFATTFNVTARAMGSNPNGTTAGIASGSIDAPNSKEIKLKKADIPDDVTITASPRMNLKKQYRTQGPVTIDNIIYLRVQYTWWIETWKHDINNNTNDDPDPKLGNEMIVGPVTFIEDPSTVSPNAYLERCNRVNVTAYPYDTYNATYPERSVLNAGTVSCSNTGPTATGPITVTVTGADYSLTHVPTQTRSGASLSSDRGIASFGTFYVLVPVSDIDNAGGTLASVNTLTGFDPVSISGISNRDEDVSDNTVARSLVAGKGSWSKLFRHSMAGENDAGRLWYSPPTTATANWAGDGVIQRGQTFATSSGFNNNTFGEVAEVEICDVIDTSLYDFAERNNAPGVPHYVYSSMASGGEGVGYEVKYGINYVGTWPPTSYPDAAALKTECTDPSVQWFSTYTAAKAAGTVTKALFRRLTPQPIGGGSIIFKHQVKAGITDPNRTLLTNMATFRTSLSSMEWRDCNYTAGAFPTPTQVYNSCGDRLALTQSTARIVKTTVPNDLIDVVQAGGTIRYKLAPDFTSENAISDNIKVIDSLPAGLAYATNSAVWNGSPTEPTITGTVASGQTLTWDLGTWAANMPIPSIEFDAEVPITAANGTKLDNSVMIVAVTDGSSDAQRSDERRITVTSPSSLVLAKTTTTPLEDQDSFFNFVVKYYNGTPEDIDFTDIIDILPYNEDNRNPESSFTGSFVISPPTYDTTNGVLYFTNRTPASDIVNDPQDSSNVIPGGATQWCTTTEFNTLGCPTGYGDVTAIRLQDNAVLSSQVSRSLTVGLTPTGNYGGEIYTNIAQAYGEGVTLSAYSPYATARVIEKSEIGLAKRLSTQDGVDLTFTFVLENLGNTTLSSITLIDDMDATFGAGNYTVTTLPVVTVQPATGILNANATYTGTGVNTNLLDPAETNELPFGTTATVTVTVTLNTLSDQGNGLGVFENTATAEGEAPSGNTVSDTADDGVEPDTNGNGIASDTDESDPTPITILPFDRSDAPVDGSATPSGSGLTSYGRAIHSVIDDIQLGANNDVDLTSIASATAAGDGSDDDGVNLLDLIPGTNTSISVSVNQTAANEGYLQGWIDWNGDGDFTDSDENIAIDLQLGTGTSGLIIVPITVPATATTMQTFARFRWSTTETLDSTSAAPNGEVEDYVITIVEKTADVLARPASCEAYNNNGWLTPGGAYINTGVQFGSGDPERDPYVYAGLYKDSDGRVVTYYGTPDNQNTGALVDPARFELNQDNPVSPGPYVSEYHSSVYKLEGNPGATVTVKFISGGGADNIYAWIEDTAGDVMTTSPEFVYGLFNEVPLTFTYPADGVVYLYGSIFDPSGNYGATKLEDYICPHDYGDAPDSYGTTIAANGARHSAVTDVYLGASRPDADADGVPGVLANNDDTNSASDDEDGVAVLPALSTLDTSYKITVSATNASASAGRLMAWIDFDGNGTFDTDEAAVRVVPAGTAAGNFVVAWANIPSDIQLGTSYLRLRFTTDSINAGEPTGIKSDGEVEDYLLPITSSGITLSGRVYIDANSNTLNDTGESGIGSTVVVLRNMSTSVCRSVKTSGDGFYGFAGVANGNYEIYQAHGETTPTPQNCGTASANNPTGYQSTTADILTVAVSGVDVVNQNFGEVAGATNTAGVNAGQNTGFGITFEPDHQSEVLPGNVAFYSHVFTTEADGSVSFNATGADNSTTGWAHLLYRDSNCNGTLDGTDGNASIANINFGIAAGSRLCIIDKVYAPANAPALDRYTVETTATFTHAGGTLPATTLTVTDLTITGQSVAPAVSPAIPVVGESRLELRKTVENITEVLANGLTEGALETEGLNQAKPGDVLKYRIYYRNSGTGPITDLKVNDTVPAYTLFVNGSASCDNTPASLACTPTVAVDALDWGFVGTLQGGASGNVSYEVVIDN